MAINLNFSDWVNWAYDKSTVAGDAAKSISDTITTAESNFLKNVRLGETVYAYDEDRFPNNIGMEDMGHYISIRAYTGGTTEAGSIGVNPPAYNAYTANLFIPGAAPGEQMPLIYDQNHNFTDIRLTNIINDSILGVSVALATKRSINPMVQVLYRSTNLRQFDFSFLMVPRNENESQTIEKIVRNIRGFAAPEFVGPTVIAPSEFEIKFMNGNEEDQHLPKIERCVITKVQANFAPPGTYSAFRNGYPVSCLLTFSATEVRLIDRTKILQKGF